MEALRRRSMLNALFEEKDYLAFTPVSSGTFTFTSTTVNGTTNSLSYSVDNGRTWSVLPSGVATPTISYGKKIMWKGDNLVTLGSVSGGIGTFSSTTTFIVSGNIMSLCYGDNFEGKTTLYGKDAFFAKLFEGSKVTNAADLSLPATTLSQLCYYRMFYNCLLLTAPPKILPAKTLTSSCYSAMFNNCQKITYAPEILATTLAYGCCSNMFYFCSSLTSAPVLRARTLTDYCYYNMFKTCRKLKYVKAMFVSINGMRSTEDWLYNVSSSGTFVKNSAATWTSQGDSGIPYGWTVETSSS